MATNARPAQRVNYTGCPARVLINQQASGMRKITTAVNHHDGHIIAKDVYNSYQHVKKLKPEHFKYVEDLMKVHAPLRNIVSCLSNETGYRI